MAILVFRAIGVIYLMAFVSLYVQFPGLYGANGLQPVDDYLDRISRHFQSSPSLSSSLFEQFLTIPSLAIFSSSIGLNGDIFCQFLLLVGIYCSTLISFGAQNSLVFLAVWICYLSIFVLGQVFLSFQWDILLLEVGFLAFLNSFFNQNGKMLSVFRWCYRFLIWKLMFMAGVVKLQANCPTWLHLTALEYHFATQCLPNSMSWYFHQLHPLILRIGVIFTLLVEIPWTFLLIAPFDFTRRIGVLFQALLQIFIIFTGNYNFFNLLTIILLIPVWSSDLSFMHDKDPLKLSRQRFNPLIDWKIQLLGIIVFFLYSFYVMIEVKITHENQSTINYIDWISVDLSPNFHVDEYVTPGSALAIVTCIVFSLIQVISDSVIWQKIFSREKNGLKKLELFLRFLFLLIGAGLVILYIQFSALPLSGIKADVQPYILSDVMRYSRLPQVSGFHLFSGYGLFRTMTGVGGLSSQQRKSVHFIGNLPPSVVARPEIILEGYDKNSNQWIEIPFKYKPDKIFKTPPLNIPHQPRLDWQMWFAALGSYDYNAWFVHLVYKLLRGDCPEILSLLDEPNYPFKNTPPLSIRSTLYEYDFTRLDTYWNRNIPGVEILSNYSIFQRMEPPAHFPWWQRKRIIREYLPQLDLTNPSLKQFLEGNGYKIHTRVSLDELETQCLNYDESKYYLRWICLNTIKVRRFSMITDPWTLVKTVLILIIIHETYTRIVRVGSESGNRRKR